MTIREAICLFDDDYVWRRLVRHVFSKGKREGHFSDILLFVNEKLGDEDYIILSSLKERLLEGEPLAYVLWYEYFRWEKFLVNSATLIPRAETEYLVQEVLDYTKTCLPCLENSRCVLVDVGTWSWCIGLSLMKESAVFFDDCFLLDYSWDALLVADKNRKMLLDDSSFSSSRVSCLESDLLWHENYESFFDADETIFVANLPYIPDDYVGVEKDVDAFEPQTALYSWKDGLKDYRKLLEQIMSFRKKKSLKCSVFMEMMGEQYDVLEQEYRSLGRWEMKKTFHDNIVIALCFFSF